MAAFGDFKKNRIAGDIAHIMPIRRTYNGDIMEVRRMRLEKEKRPTAHVQLTGRFYAVPRQVHCRMKFKNALAFLVTYNPRLLLLH